MARGAGFGSRWFRSPSGSCATRWTSTAGWPESPKTSPCGTGSYSCCSWCGSQHWVPPLPSASPELQALRARMMRGRPAVRRGWPVFPYTTTVRVSLWTGVAVVAVLFAWGAWQRRWIADDGLIVLRTVRNLLVGNGPVVIPGERVEANPSAVLTYLVYFASAVTQPLRLEYVALALALGLS